MFIGYFKTINDFPFKITFNYVQFNLFKITLNYKQFQVNFVARFRHFVGNPL